MPLPLSPSGNPPTYPENGTYADLLCWHLFVWRTRPGGSRVERGTDPWTESEFCDKVHDNNNTSPASKNRNFRNWTGEGTRCAPYGSYHKGIKSNLFGGNKDLSTWSKDLDLSIKRSSPKPNNIRNIDYNKLSIELTELISGAGLANSKSDGVQGSHLGANAREGVAGIAEKLAGHFYGRDSDLKAITAFVEERMAGLNKGLLVITAPAGFGKSALAVNWCMEAEGGSNRHVVKHLCSTTDTATTKHSKIFSNLRRQIAEVYGERFDSAITDEDAVVGILATAPPDGRQLVVWLDGIDEADTSIDCFLPRRLGERVSVIVSARADKDITPSYVDEWLHSERAKHYDQPEPYKLAKLTLDGVDQMVGRMFASETRSAPPKRLGQRIFNASEQGYPLFARLMVEDAIAVVKDGGPIDFGKKPESLAGYAENQLKRLRKLGVVWREHQTLFAFLTVARQAVCIDELPALIGESVLFEAIPDQISRWFILIKGSGGAPLLSFAHLKLKEMFGQALGYQRGVATRNFCDRILKADQNEWPSYAWHHLPNHLLEASMPEEAIHKLTDFSFINQRFKYVGAQDCPALMARDWASFSIIYSEDREYFGHWPDLERHLRLWNNHAVRLIRAGSQGFVHAWKQIFSDVGLSHDTMTTCLLAPLPSSLPKSLATFVGHTQSIKGVLQIEKSPGFVSWSDDSTLRFWGPMGEPGPVMHSHEGPVKGAILLAGDGGFLSWGGTSVRRWGPQGEELQVLDGDGTLVRGVVSSDREGLFLVWCCTCELYLWDSFTGTCKTLVGHEGNIVGAAALSRERGFLSWSYDGTLQLWGINGESGSIMSGHNTWVAGALELPDDAGFLSWGGDGSVRLWGQNGEFVAEMIGHEEQVYGAMAISDNSGFISWGEDCTIRLWSSMGDRMSILCRHEDAVKGTLSVENGASFFSWANNIVPQISPRKPLKDVKARLWNILGEKIVDFTGHTRSITGAIKLKEDAGFVTWSLDRTLRLWSIFGDQKAIFRDQRKHINGAMLLQGGGRFISWSDDKTLKLWSANFTDAENSDTQETPVVDAIPLKGRVGFLSWHADFSLCISIANESDIVFRGHQGPIYGALSLENEAGFLTWSGDKTLRLWGPSGEEGPELIGHEDAVFGALQLPNSAGFLSWSADGTLRLWGPFGEQGPVLQGHEAFIEGALVLTNGNGFLSWSGDGTLRRWSPDGEGPLLTLVHGSGGLFGNMVLGAFELGGGKGFVSWGVNEKITWWSADGERRAYVSAHERFNGVMLLSDGVSCISWGFGGHYNGLKGEIVNLWTHEGELVGCFGGHKSCVNGALVLPDASGFLSWGADGVLQKWNLDSDTKITMSGHTGEVIGALTLGTNAGFLSWGEDDTLRRWNSQGVLMNLWISPGGTIRTVKSLDIPDHFLVVFGDHAGIVRLKLMADL